MVLAQQPVIAVGATQKARMLGGHGGRVLLVVPESRGSELLLELSDPRPQRIGIKGNHGPSRAGPRSPRADPAVTCRAGRPCRAAWYRRSRLLPGWNHDAGPGLETRCVTRPVRRPR